MALPRESRDLDATVIPVGHVQPGMSLAVDGGLGKPQLFQGVEKSRLQLQEARRTAAT